MAKYIQKVALAGRERWIGWEIDGVGTEIPGLYLADRVPEQERVERGVRSYAPMSFDDFIGLNAIVTKSGDGSITDEDLEFRLDAVQVGLDRMFSRGFTEIPAGVIEEMLGGLSITEPRVSARLREWEERGQVELVCTDSCYLRLTGRFS